jgi:glucokinase
MLLPLLFSDKHNINSNSITVLAADVGATKTNFAFFSMKGNDITRLKEAAYPSKQYTSLAVMANDFLKALPAPEAVCFGVAGPVLNGKATLTNLSWDINSGELATQIGVKEVQLINDLEATAYGLALLDEKDTMLLHKGGDQPSGNAAVIAPGTGLGEAGLFWDGKLFHPFATEGGHSDFAPRNTFDFELYEYLQNQFGHVSWERLVCGPGIVTIYQFLRDEKKRAEPAWLAEKINTGDAAAIISQHILQSDLCKETMHHFVRYLAYESANLVLKMKATGGLFIGGGIAPKIADLIMNEQFSLSYCSSGRLNSLLEKVPVKIILNPQTALLGAAYYAAGYSTTATT